MSSAKNESLVETAQRSANTGIHQAVFLTKVWRFTRKIPRLSETVQTMRGTMRPPMRPVRLRSVSEIFPSSELKPSIKTFSRMQMRNILGDWYEGKACALCGSEFKAVEWHDHKPALLSPEGTLVDWTTFPPEQVIDVLARHRPVCWNCRVSEGFRREHPELVTDRPPRLGPPPSMA